MNEAMTTTEYLNKWDQRFLDLAAQVATWSKDPSTQVGAVIVGEDRRVFSLGYNGFPRQVEDRAERYNDRPTKYQYVVHAEANAIVQAEGSLYMTTIYVTPFAPCNECAKLIIQAGITRVVAPRQAQTHWSDSQTVADTMFREANVEQVFLDV